jgi:F-type H+-transporting ATPase subunit epsilon
MLMADTVQFELVSPERLLVSGPVEMVVVPGAEGDFGVLPGHAPLISTVRTGVISIFDGGKVNRRIFVSGGFAEVTPERCTVLADEAVALDSVDRAAIDARIKAARDDLADAGSDAERAKASAELAVAEALLASIEARPYG